MYAIIKAGGKQFKVGVGDLIDIDSLGSVENGSEIHFEEVLLVYDGDKTHVGVPTVPNFAVKAEFVDSILGPKVISYKYKRRKRQSVKKGHRQNYSRVKITSIGAPK